MAQKETMRKVPLDELRAAVREEPESAKAHLKLGSALLKAGFQREAEQELRRSIELEPSLVEGWVNLAGALFLRWDFRGCVEANAKAIAHDPGRTRPYYNQGLGYLYLGEAEPMLECFETVVEREPDNGGGHYYKAVALHGLKRSDEARVSLNRAMALGFKAEPDFLKALGKEADGDVPVMEVGPGCSKTDS